MKSDTSHNTDPAFDAFSMLLMLGMTLAISCAVFAEDWCQPWDCTSYPTRQATDWRVEDNVAATDQVGRVTVVIERTLYSSVSDAIDTWAADVAEEGYGVVIATCNSDAYPEGLRDALYDVYVEDDSLVGAIMIGNLPWVTYEYLDDPEGYGHDYTEFPTDAFFMDLDGTWQKDACTNGLCDDDVYDAWNGSPAEIWVSRIRVDNLQGMFDPFPPWNETTIIQAYLERNHDHRTQGVVFGTTDDHVIAIDDNTDTPFCPPRGVEDMETVFETVDYWCYGSTEFGYAYSDYTDMLGDDENPYYWVHFHGHGSAQDHSLAGEYFWYYDYLSAATDTHVRGFTFASCNTCNFLFDNNLGGTVCFNPEADTLWVLGHSKTVAGADEDQFLEGVAAGKSIGESFKEFFNSDSCRDPRSMVLFGDGTLKPPTATWTGGGTNNNWDNPDNWDPAVEPGGNDHVFIHDDDSNPTVDVNVGSYWTPLPVASVYIEEGDSSGDVTINIQQHRGLNPRGPLMAEAGISAEIAMAVNSRLELDNSFIKNVDITMTGDSSTPPWLSVAESIADSTLSVGSYGEVDAGGFESCAVTVGTYAEVEAGDIEDSDFEVSGNATLTASGIANCDFEIAADAEVTATSISGEAGGDQDWLVEGVLEVTNSATLWGQWAVAGGSATFGSMVFNDTEEEEEVTFELSDGASVEIESFQSAQDFAYMFPDGVAHVLSYDGTGNVFGGGVANEPTWTQVMYVGTKTRIEAVDEDADLELDISGSLDIATDFRHEVVYDNWDTRYTDITAQPVFHLPHDNVEVIELISPQYDFSPYSGDPVVFLDVHWQGAFRDLDLPARDEYSEETWFLNQYNNSIVDEAPGQDWDEVDRNVPGPVEAGYFRNVSIREDRTLGLRETDGLVYFYGDRDIDASATILFQPEVGEEFEVDEEHYDDYIIPAVDTLFGDWNGDCEITNVEIAAITAIAGDEEEYIALMDFWCDGYIVGADVQVAMDNKVVQPPCYQRGGRGGEGRSFEPFEGTADLAAAIMDLVSKDEISEEWIKDYLDRLAEAAVLSDETQAGVDAAALLEELLKLEK